MLSTQNVHTQDERRRRRRSKKKIALRYNCVLFQINGSDLLAIRKFMIGDF